MKYLIALILTAVILFSACADDTESGLYVRDSEGNIEKEEEKPAFIGLAHELIHGDHYQRGVYDPNKEKVTYQIDGKDVISTTREEWRTIGIGGYNIVGDITENDIRKETNLCERLHH